MSEVRINDNCLGCPFLREDMEVGPGGCYCMHPGLKGHHMLICDQPGGSGGMPPTVMRPRNGDICPLLNDPVTYTGGTFSWPPEPPTPPMSNEEVASLFASIGHCPHCGRRI